MLEGTPMIDELPTAPAGRWVEGGVSRRAPAGDTCSGRSRGSLRSGPLAPLAELADGVLEGLVAQHRALEPSGADVDPEQLEQVVGAEGADLVERLALDLVGEERRAGLADRAATTSECDALEDAVM